MINFGCLQHVLIKPATNGIWWNIRSQNYLHNYFDHPGSFHFAGRAFRSIDEIFACSQISIARVGRFLAMFSFMNIPYIGICTNASTTGILISKLWNTLNLANSWFSCFLTNLYGYGGEITSLDLDWSFSSPFARSLILFFRSLPFHPVILSNNDCSCSLCMRGEDMTCCFTAWPASNSLNCTLP